MSRYERPSHRVYCYFFFRQGWQVQVLQVSSRKLPDEQELNVSHRPAFHRWLLSRAGVRDR